MLLQWQELQQGYDCDHSHIVRFLAWYVQALSGYRVGIVLVLAVEEAN